MEQEQVTQAATSWKGSDDGMPPRDWDGGPVLLRKGCWVDPSYLESNDDGYSAYWRNDECSEDIVGYRARLASTRAQAEAAEKLAEALEEVKALAEYGSYLRDKAETALAEYREAKP